MSRKGNQVSYLKTKREGSDIMFSGEFEHSLDAKGRVIIPSRMREQLGDVFYITKGIEHNLLIFSVEDWNEFYAKLNSLPVTNRNARGFKRLFLSGAVECEANAQGRILIPATLREYAGIDKDVTIIGNGNNVEIWDTNTWKTYMDELDADLIAEGLDEVGISI